MGISGSARARAVKSAVAVVVGLLMLTGCNGSFAGLGQMSSANLSSRTKASLGFSVICNANTQVVTGSLSYVDSAARTNINAKATERGYVEVPYEGYVPAECDNDPTEGHYLGTFSGTVNGIRSSGQVQFDLENDVCGRGLAYVRIALNGAQYVNAGCMTVGYVTSLSPRSSTVG